MLPKSQSFGSSLLDESGHTMKGIIALAVFGILVCSVSGQANQCQEKCQVSGGDGSGDIVIFRNGVWSVLIRKNNAVCFVNLTTNILISYNGDLRVLSIVNIRTEGAIVINLKTNAALYIQLTNIATFNDDNVYSSVVAIYEIIETNENSVTGDVDVTQGEYFDIGVLLTQVRQQQGDQWTFASLDIFSTRQELAGNLDANFKGIFVLYLEGYSNGNITEADGIAGFFFALFRTRSDEYLIAVTAIGSTLVTSEVAAEIIEARRDSYLYGNLTDEIIYSAVDVIADYKSFSDALTALESGDDKVEYYQITISGTLYEITRWVSKSGDWSIEIVPSGGSGLIIYYNKQYNGLVVYSLSTKYAFVILGNVGFYFIYNGNTGVGIGVSALLGTAVYIDNSSNSIKTLVLADSLRDAFVAIIASANSGYKSIITFSFSAYLKALCAGKRFETSIQNLAANLEANFSLLTTTLKGKTYSATVFFVVLFEANGNAVYNLISNVLGAILKFKCFLAGVIVKAIFAVFSQIVKGGVELVTEFVNELSGAANSIRSLTDVFSFKFSASFSVEVDEAAQIN